MDEKEEGAALVTILIAVGASLFPFRLYLFSILPISIAVSNPSFARCRVIVSGG